MTTTDSNQGGQIMPTTVLLAHPDLTTYSASLRLYSTKYKLSQYISYLNFFLNLITCQMVLLHISFLDQFSGHSFGSHHI